MTSIKKDLRELAKNWTSCYSGEDCAVELESLIPRIVAAVEQAGPCGKPYHLQVNQYPYRVRQGGLGTYCTVCEAIEQAQVEAIQSAAEKPNMLSNPQVIAEKMPSCSTPIAVASVCEAITKSILSLTPRRVQIEAELRRLTDRLEEAERIPVHLWPQSVGEQKSWNMHRTGRIETLESAIAALERELEAERKEPKP